MICDQCPNGLYKRTGVTGCWLPNCIRDIDDIARQLAKLTALPHKNHEQLYEMEWLRTEIERRNKK